MLEQKKAKMPKKKRNPMQQKYSKICRTSWAFFNSISKGSWQILQSKLSTRVCWWILCKWKSKVCSFIEKQRTKGLCMQNLAWENNLSPERKDKWSDPMFQKKILNRRQYINWVLRRRNPIYIRSLLPIFKFWIESFKKNHWKENGKKLRKLCS